VASATNLMIEQPHMKVNRVAAECEINLFATVITVIADATFRINHQTAAKTVIPEFCALLQILLHLVTYCYTCDRGMWHYGITVIVHEALFCKSG
jgi:hypothetical protein